MTLRSARFAVRATIFKTYDKLASLVFIFCTLLMLASVVRMWSHWFQISASFGFYRATLMLVAITGAAFVVSWWVNTGND
jgi:hypothetical protein